MEVSYIKDLRINYMVISEVNDSSEKLYCIKMLQANDIPGILGPDLRSIDNKVYYYYDITSKQALEIIYDKTPINYGQLKSLFFNITEIIDQAYEYLLDENDLVLEPKYIYTDLSSGKIYLCYLPGYNADIRKQLISFIEYLMNKVDYKDNEAVLYIYNLYAVSREDAFSYERFIMQVKRVAQDDSVSENIRQRKSKTWDKCEEKPQEGKKIENKGSVMQIPVMQEKISNDQETYYYPLKIYIYTVACCLGAISVFIAGLKAKIIYNSLGTRIDYSKLVFLLLILLAVTGYLLKKIWDKNNRITKVIRNIEYINPALNTVELDDTFSDDVKQEQCTLSLKNTDIYQNYEDINPTVLLNKDMPSYGCRLEPMDNTCEVIQIRNFPFIIGKQKGHVDYLLDKEIVSRYHVKIIKEENKYYIMDLNSTNGTCLNNNALCCYQRYELKDGDEIAIAGIKYTFKEKAF
ncbi:MAG TPA: DUF6382 domain-containing protein [Mobilitalea sp.]|nr:DUF6382 domain-containing protein [Mobilitalea sp.]